MGEGVGTRWGVREWVLLLPQGVTTANLFLSLGLGLPVARGKDWTSWSLRALPAVTFSSGTEGGGQTFLEALLCAKGSFFIIPQSSQEGIPIRLHRPRS